MSRSITCTNNNGMTVTFSDSAFSPFILASAEGIYMHENTVNYEDNTMIDGATYQGSTASVRNIVLTLLDQPTNVFNQYNRDLLYTLFEQDRKGTLTFEEDGSARQIDYYVESIHRANVGTRAITVSLICVDPFFYDVDNSRVTMATDIAVFEFPHNFVAEGEPLGEITQATIKNIVNENASNNIGLRIEIAAVGTVVNPVITRIESNESMRIGSTAKPFTLSSGQKLVITTGTGDKHVKRVSDGGAETEVNEYLTEDSVFIQLMKGNNNISYSADTGSEFMDVTILYKFKYGGA